MLSLLLLLFSYLIDAFLSYVNVDEANDVQLFYYFIKSEREPKDDPLLLWLTGGPGCSALSGLIYEIGNEAGYGVHLNLKGHIVGNPCTDANYDGDAIVPYAHGVGFISDELYESTKNSCGGRYQNPSNAECARWVDSVNQDLSGINTAHILEPLCSFPESPKPNIITAGRRRLLEALSDLPTSNTRDPFCRNYWYLLSHAWANNDTVRQALGIREW
ncbi:hypothetical protein C4D60_Mb11t00890 [Musa balbisiana]|uniref:Carboxypeptidase n=1 Tax=Musa balbisiana TaxID=52838 RepID=A0A4S8J0R5_MUSBA|nr:hypothetical protein C4D60_Mb11t00890 [Musa balbisiana]